MLLLTAIAAWLGWTFDGLDMHLYTLVAAPFVAELIGVAATTDPRVGRYGSIVQGGFMLGWALGGGFFGRIGDRLGRARALSLTVLTYAAFTGLSVFAHAWWHLLIFRFLAALGIGGEWAVGASLLSETWPRQWRPWIAAVLQTGVNVGILGAGLANIVLAAAPPRYLFLVGVLPGSAVPCRNPPNGAPPRRPPTTMSRACATCSAARCGPSRYGSCWSAASR